MRRPPVPRRALALMGVFTAAVVGLQAVHEQRGGPLVGVAGNFLYIQSPEAMKRLSLSYEALLSDLYWIRSVQHYGDTKLSTDPNKQYDLLYPLLDLTTSLDPRFDAAYQYGSIFLAEPAPDGPGRPDLAIALLEKGLRVQPGKWEFAHAIGFVHYWWLQDYEEAAAWFRRAAGFPDAPVWMAPLAATTLAQGGRRELSRALWQEIARTAGDGWFRNEALRRLRQLDAMEELERLQAVADAFRQRLGAAPEDWDALRRAGYLRALPVDPSGTPYLLRDGRPMLDPGSPLNPLPTEPLRLQ